MDHKSHLKRSMESLVTTLLDCTLYRDAILSEQSSTSKTSFSKDMFKLTLCNRALHIVKMGGVNFLNNWQSKGWTIVKSEGTLSGQLADDALTGNEEDAYENEDLVTSFDQISVKNKVKELAENISLEHSYDAMGKVCLVLKCLVQLACNNFYYSVINKAICDLPEQATSLSTFSSKSYLKLCICTCYSFITRGQSHFCKYLFATLAKANNITSPKELLIKSEEQVPLMTTSINLNPSNDKNESCSWQKIMALMRQSHPANDEEKMGKILKILHTQRINGVQQSGRLAKQAPHNQGN